MLQKNLLAKILLAQMFLDNSLMKLKWLQHLAAAQVITTVIGWLARHRNMCLARHRNEITHIWGQITCEIRLQGDQARDELMSHLLWSNLSHNMIRMSPVAFLELCDMLVK